jgi:hypothetical protein
MQLSSKEVQGKFWVMQLSSLEVQNIWVMKISSNGKKDQVAHPYSEGPPRGLWRASEGYPSGLREASEPQSHRAIESLNSLNWLKCAQATTNKLQTDLWQSLVLARPKVERKTAFHSAQP